MNIQSFMGVLTLIFPVVAQPLDDHCYQRAAPINRDSLFCKGVVIPASKSRNFISEELFCGSGSHTYTRKPVPFDEEVWRDTFNVDPSAAQSMLRDLPVPQWSGAVLYNSYLYWSWEECQRVTSASECGTEEVCETRKKNDKKEERVCRQEAKTCYADVVVRESVVCSHEKLSYDVQFIPTAVDDESYQARLANGYDLLPGEHEWVEVNNGVRWSAVLMHPQLLIKEPRNKYQVERLLGNSYDSKSLPCQKNRVYHIGFSVLSQGRIRSRSGNGFSLPRSFDDEPIEPLVWQSAKNTAGNRQDKGYPAIIRVQDYSAVALNEFALDTDNLFKNLVIRLQLYDQSTFALPFARSTIYIEEQSGVKQTLNAMSEDQNIRRSYMWEMMLETDTPDPDRNLYRNFIPWFVYYPARIFLPADELSYENQLHPETNYQLILTVYQRGLPIYYQSCEDEPEARDCQYYLGAGWLSPSRYENGYYSEKSLDIAFTSPANINLRTWGATFWNSVAYLDNIVLAGLVIVMANRCLKKL